MLHKSLQHPRNASQHPHCESKANSRFVRASLAIFVQRRCSVGQPRAAQKSSFRDLGFLQGYPAVAVGLDAKGCCISLERGGLIRGSESASFEFGLPKEGV